MRGKLVIFSGPSGVGKDTLLDAWRESNNLVKRVVACTTRASRPGEVDGVDYHFKSHHEFEALIAANAFLEHKLVFGNYYGTPVREMEQMLAEGLIAVLKIDVQGAITAMELRPDATTIFVMPPSMDELDRRIRARATETSDVIEKRLATAHAEIELSSRYQYKIVNDQINRAVAQLNKIVSNPAPR